MLKIYRKKSDASLGLHPVYDCNRADAAAAKEVHMRVEGVMCAMVALAAAGRPEAARVVLMSAEEVLSGKDAWDSSCHQVFRYATAASMLLLLHFLSPCSY